MRQVFIPEFGPAEVLEQRSGPDPRPGPGQVRIRVEACGVNFADVMGRQGVYPELPPLPAVPGFEVAGRVDAVGPEADPAWADRDVLALTQFGGYADVVCVPEHLVQPRPPGMSAAEGAALPVNYLTAYLLVERMGGLRADETILVHSAGGGVGVAAIQLARRIGARVIGTASAHKHDFLKSLGVDTCIDYTAEDFEARVREITRGFGVELVLDPVGGPSFAKSSRCLSPTGRLGMFGMSAVAAGKSKSWLGALRTVFSTPWLRFTPPALINQSKGVFGVNLGRLWEQRDRVTRWSRTLIGYYVEGSIRPVLSAKFPFDRAADAHRHLEQRRNLGKVVLTP